MIPRLPVALWAAILVAAVACGPEPTTTPGKHPDAAARSAKAPASLSVTSASPAFGDQGTTVDVHVFGTGFVTGAQAKWLLHGIEDPSHIRTNSTSVLSSTELVANITIAGDAPLAFWDVQVALAGGKNGVGTECFEVTSAQILDAGTTGGDAAVHGMNDLGQVVGEATAGSTTNGWVYDPSAGMINLGTGAAKGIDPLGAFVVGANSRSNPIAWINAGTLWTPQALPQPSGSLGASANAVARLSDGTALVVGSNAYSNRKYNAAYPNQAVAWRRALDGTWSMPQVYAMPPGFVVANAFDVNPLEEVVGGLETQRGVVWDSPTSYTVLDGKATGINNAGTLIVGQNSSNVPVYWWHDPVTHQWRLPATPLPSIAGSSCADGFALDANDAGVIVGWSCTPNGKLPTVWKLDLSGPAPVLSGTPAQLPTLGIKNSVTPQVARSVTNSSPFVVSGEAAISSSRRVAVQWNLR